MALPSHSEDPRPTAVQPPVRDVAPAAPRQRDGLRLSTLVIAAVASGAAAVIVSHFWQRGTIIASAMTPVVVAVVSEMLRRPVESDLVRKPLRVARSAVTTNAPVTFERRERKVEGVSAPDVRIYSTGSDRARTRPRRQVPWRVAIVTGLIAFAIGAAFLTLPELIFGGSVTGHRSTTIFGGGHSSKKKSTTEKDSSSKDSSSKDTTSKSSGSDQTTTEQTTTTAPDQTTTQPPQQQQQTTTQQQAPPTTTTPAPPTTTTPAPPPTP